MKYFVGALAAASALVAGPALAAEFYDFSTPVVTGSAPAPGVWSTDRYAPAGFETVGGELHHTISTADSANNRPAAFSGAFYNTQGRKFELEDGTTSLSIDLFVANDWLTTGNRMAGLWGEGVDGSDTIVAYPILEFAGLGGGTFRGWDSTPPGAYGDLGLPAGFAADNWYTLNIRLGGGQFHYSVGLQGGALTELGSVNALGATSISNVILQGHNTQTGVDNLIRWDNLTTGVPEPGAWALMILGFGSAGAMLRRRRAAVLAA